MSGLEWNEEKNKSNLEKHKIAFDDAINVFDDVNRIQYISIKNGEKRFLTIGKAHNALISVIYTVRKTVIRIISARRSRKEERRNYLINKLNKNDDSK